jgi:methylglutaconyl-CoA hydratase
MHTDDSAFQHLTIERAGTTTTVWLNRPEVHNAFGKRLIEELGTVFTELGADDTTRVIVLAGKGASFSAGADVNWMRDSVDYSRQQNVDDAERLALMLEAIARCDKPVVCCVQGLALGGALGLIAAADYAIASDDALFSFSEVKLGLVPAVISPFVLRRIGPGQARPLFVTGERFDAARAHHIGLVHVVVPEEKLQEEVARVCNELLTAAPDAIRVAKHLVMDGAYQSPRDAFSRTVETIATKRTDPEGQEGLNAFLEKRRPSWMDDSHNPAWVGGRS